MLSPSTLLTNDDYALVKMCHSVLPLGHGPLIELKQLNVGLDNQPQAAQHCVLNGHAIGQDEGPPSLPPDCVAVGGGSRLQTASTGRLGPSSLLEDK